MKSMVKHNTPSQGKKEAELALVDADEIERRPINGGVSINSYLLFGAVLAIAVWAGLSNLDQVVVARGKLVTPQPNIVIQPLETARIEALNVRVGQIVRQGQTLATLDRTIVVADRTQLQDKLDSLDAQVRRLEAERDRHDFVGTTKPDDILQRKIWEERQNNYRSHSRRLQESIGRLKASLVTNAEDSTTLESQLKSLQEIEEMNRTLNSQKIQSRLQLLQSQERRQSLERQLVVTRSRRFELQRELGGAEAELGAFTNEWRQKLLEELVTVGRERDSLIEQLQKVDLRHRSIVLNSPIDGVVSEMAKRTTGSIIKEAEPLLSLVPVNSDLEAEVQIDSKDIGELKVGDQVRIKIDAYPFQKYGVLRGNLDRLSQDAFNREATQGQPAGTFYIGRVEIKDIHFEHQDRTAYLLPGMSLAVEIVTGKRSIISYFLYPILRSLDEAAREP